MTVENLLFMILGGVIMFMVGAVAFVIVAVRAGSRARQLEEDAALEDAENEALAARIRAAGPARWVRAGEMPKPEPLKPVCVCDWVGGGIRLCPIHGGS